MTVEIVLAPGRSAFPVEYPDGTLAGYRVTHPCSYQPVSETGAWITVDPEIPKHWDLVSMDPLHLEPSLLCTVCNDHGFIRDGKWVAA